MTHVLFLYIFFFEPCTGDICNESIDRLEKDKIICVNVILAITLREIKPGDQGKIDRLRNLGNRVSFLFFLGTKT